MVGSQHKLVKFNTSTNTYTETIIDPVQSTSRTSLGLIAIDGQDNIWFTSIETINSTETSYVRKVAPDGSVTNYTYSIPDLEPGCPQAISGLQFGSDGTLWGYGGDINVCDTQPSGLIVKLNPSTGAILDKYTVAGTGFIIKATAGSAGKLLFADIPYARGDQVLGVMSQDGTYQTYSAQSVEAGLSIVQNLDNSYWGTVFNSSEGNLVKAGNQNNLTSLPDSGQKPLSLALAKDNKLWFGGVSSVGIVNSDGGLQAFPLSSGLYVLHLENDSNNNLWGLAADMNNGGFKVIKIRPENIVETQNPTTTATSTSIKAPKTGNLAIISLITFAMLSALLSFGIIHHKHTHRKTTSQK